MRLVRSNLYFPVVRGLVATVQEAKTTLHPGTSKAKIFFKRDFSRFHFIKLPISRRCLVRRRLTATRLESEASRMRRHLTTILKIHPSLFSVRNCCDPLELFHSALECPRKEQLPAGAQRLPVRNRNGKASMVGRRWGYEIGLWGAFQLVLRNYDSKDVMIRSKTVRTEEKNLDDHVRWIWIWILA